MIRFQKFHVPALALAFALTTLPAAAQEVQGAQAGGSATIGAQTGSGINDSSKLQQYETVPKGFSLLGANFNWANSAGYFITVDTNKIGLDDQYASVKAGQGQAWTLTFSLNQNPRWFSNTAETLYTQSAPGVFTLPDGLRSSLQRIWSPKSGTDPAAPANSSDPRFWSLRDYVNGSQATDLRYVRKTGEFGLDVSKFENWKFNVSYQREVRNGSQPTSFTAGPGIDEIANPIQYTTDDARAEVEYARGGFFVNTALSHNVFTNDIPYTIVDNPVRLNNTDYFWTGTAVTTTNANATARLWNAPNNKATSFDATTGKTLPRHHKVTMTASVTSMTMDRTLIEQATNPNLNLATTSPDYGKFTLTPEYSAINGDMLQSLFMANVAGDPTTKFGYSAYYRVFDLNDKKPAYTFHSTVNSDGGASYSATGITTSHASYRTGQFKVEGHVAPARGIRFGLNAGHVNTSYDDRDVLSIADNTVGFSIDANRGWGTAHLGYTRLNRTPGAENPNAPGIGTSGGPMDANAAMKDVAKQDANIYNAAFTITPIEKMALTFSTQGLDANFPDTSIGLSKSRMTNYGVDAVFVFSPRVSMNGGYIFETYHMDTNLWYGANGTAAAPNATNVADKYWNATDDKIDTYQVGLRFDLIPSKADLRSDFNYSKGRSDSGFVVNPGGAAGGDLIFPTSTVVNFPSAQYLNYPEVFNATRIWKTQFNYHLNKNVTFGLLYWRQTYEAANWATDTVNAYLLNGASLYATTPGAVSTIYPLLDPSANRALFLGAQVPNYKANIVRAALTYSF